MKRLKTIKTKGQVLGNDKFCATYQHFKYSASKQQYVLPSALYDAVIDLVRALARQFVVESPLSRNRVETFGLAGMAFERPELNIQGNTGTESRRGTANGGAADCGG